MALDATVKGAAANSYITRADADTYFADRLNTSDWDNATTSNKDAALMTATSLLDMGFEWVGAIRTTTQALRWPRSGSLDRDGREYNYDLVPQPIKDAVCDTALALLQRNLMEIPEVQGLGMSEGSTNNASFVYDPTNRHDLIPRHVRMTISHMGMVRAGVTSGGGFVPVRR